MSADLLRKAANVLRERAGGATSGPWSVGMDAETQERVEIYSEFVATRYPDVSPSVAVVTTIQRPQEGDPEEKVPEWGQTTDAEFIATFTPELADHIAEWMNDHANDHDAYDCHWENCESLNVARLILGGGS
jgi:acetylornithine deacetylase/succinyl-diaminopimelate desuccinylase-like protein